MAKFSKKGWSSDPNYDNFSSDPYLKTKSRIDLNRRIGMLNRLIP